MNSAGYYDRHAAEFVARARQADLSAIYPRFIGLLPRGGHILDAGCGCGRDTAYFLSRGYRVTAIDASAEMVKASSEFTGQATLQLHFQQLEFHHQFDGVWACASLLHVPKPEMVEVVTRLIRATKPGGVLYWSVKLGQRERRQDERWFSDYTEAEMIELVDRLPELELQALWISRSAKPGCQELWVNTLTKSRESCRTHYPRTSPGS